MAAGNSVKCCEGSSDGYNSCLNPYSEDPYLNWYRQEWSQYWWWKNQHTVYQTRNYFPTWCSTCAEESEERERRLKKRETCDNSFSWRNQSEQLCKNMSSPNHEQWQVDNMTVQISDTEESGSDEFEMELNNDFKKFLEQSAKHKEERKKEAMLNQVKTDDYIEAGEIALEATTAAPTQQLAMLRTEEMKRLYGTSAHLIESLETSLQLHFNMNVDMRHPVFWPSIPLKF